MRRVVIVGMGIYSSIGTNKKEVLESLRKGFCGIGMDQSREGFNSKLTGIVPIPDKIPQHIRRYMAPQTCYMYNALSEALEDAHLECPPVNCGLIIGNDSSSQATVEAVESYSKLKRTSKLGATHVFKTLTSNPTAVLSTYFRLEGPSFSVGGACASGAHAIGVSYNLIAGGAADIIAAGGCQEVNPAATFAFDAIGTFSKSTIPKEAVKPFDKNRDGLVPSGGAACLILAEMNWALEQNLQIYGEIVGYGANSSNHLSKSDLNAELECMQKALRDYSPNDVSVISAHATGTVDGDLSEAGAILGLFDKCRPYISATKALTGHEMWAAGSTEIVYSILSSKAGFVPPNINTEDGSYSLNIHRDLVEVESPKFILSNSFGLGGTNSSILIKL